MSGFIGRTRWTRVDASSTCDEDARVTPHRGKLRHDYDIPGAAWSDLCDGAATATTLLWTVSNSP